MKYFSINNFEKNNWANVPSKFPELLNNFWGQFMVENETIVVR